MDKDSYLQTMEKLWQQNSTDIFNFCMCLMHEDEDEATGIWAYVYTLFMQKHFDDPKDARAWLFRETRDACERRNNYLANEILSRRESWLRKLLKKIF